MAYAHDPHDEHAIMGLVDHALGTHPNAVVLGPGKFAAAGRARLFGEGVDVRLEPDLHVPGQASVSSPSCM